jgi:hypothetical protein
VQAKDHGAGSEQREDRGQSEEEPR